MTDNWERRSATIRLDKESLTRLLRPVFKDPRIVNFALTDGGKANTNYRVMLGGLDDAVMVRLFTRDPKAAVIEAALHRMVSGAVPVAEYLHTDKTNPVTGHPYAILKWMPGEHLGETLDKASPSERRALGIVAGKVLAGIGAYRFAKAGFFDGDLDIKQALDIGSQGFLHIMRQWLFEELAGQRLGEQLRDDFWRFLDAAADILDEWTGPPCLVHSDFGGSNILVRKADSRWIVSAVLDWEFAFSGCPLVDIGHVLRRPAGDMPEFESGLIEGYRTNGGDLTTSWKPMARLLDLMAWVDFLNQPGDRPNLYEAARQTVVDTMDEWPQLT